MDDHVIRSVCTPTETEPVNRPRSDEIMNKSNEHSLKIVADHATSKNDDCDSGTESDSGEMMFNFTQDLHVGMCDMSVSPANNYHKSPLVAPHHCQALSSSSPTTSTHLPSSTSQLSATAFTPFYIVATRPYSSHNALLRTCLAQNALLQQQIYNVTSDVDCCAMLERVTLTSERAATGNTGGEGQTNADVSASDLDRYCGDAQLPSEDNRSLSEFTMTFSSSSSSNADDDEVSCLLNEQRHFDDNEENFQIVPRDFTCQPPPLLPQRDTVQTISPRRFFSQRKSQNDFWALLLGDRDNYTPVRSASTECCLSQSTDERALRPSLNFEKMQKRLLPNTGRCHAFKKTSSGVRCSRSTRVTASSSYYGD